MLRILLTYANNYYKLYIFIIFLFPSILRDLLYNKIVVTISNDIIKMLYVVCESFQKNDTQNN